MTQATWSLKHPAALLLLLLVPVLVVLRHSYRRRALTYSDGRMIEMLPRTWGERVQVLFPVLYVLGLLSLIVALACPRQGLSSAKVRAEVVDIMLVVDVSGSMETLDFSTGEQRLNRLDAARLVLEDFVRSRSGDRLGLIAFATFPYTVSPLTLDHDWLVERMEKLAPGILPGDSTAIGTALASAVNRLRDSSSASRVIVLLTDGRNNAGTISPKSAARAAKALGIRVYAVGAGTAALDDALLDRITRSAGGVYFRARDMRALREVYAQIDKLERTEMELEVYTRFREWFTLFTALGAACLMTERTLSCTRFGRVP